MALNLSNLKAPKKANENKKRVGRGMARVWVRPRRVAIKARVRAPARA